MINNNDFDVELFVLNEYLNMNIVEYNKYGRPYKKVGNNVFLDMSV